jgi:hypothetical protein
MKRANVDDMTLPVPERDAVLADQDELGVGNGKRLAIRRANGERPKTAVAHSLLQLVYAHVSNLGQPRKSVKKFNLLAACPS